MSLVGYSGVLLTRLVNDEMDIENAIASGQIVFPDEFKPSPTDVFRANYLFVQ